MALKDREEVRLACLKLTMQQPDDSKKKEPFIWKWADRLMNYVYYGDPDKDINRVDKRTLNKINGETNFKRNYRDEKEVKKDIEGE